jgi:hypothetical protein
MPGLSRRDPVRQQILPKLLLHNEWTLLPVSHMCAASVT